MAVDYVQYQGSMSRVEFTPRAGLLRHTCGAELVGGGWSGSGMTVGAGRRAGVALELRVGNCAVMFNFVASLLQKRFLFGLH